MPILHNTLFVGKGEIPVEELVGLYTQVISIIDIEEAS